MAADAEVDPSQQIGQSIHAEEAWHDHEESPDQQWQQQWHGQWRSGWIDDAWHGSGRTWNADSSWWRSWNDWPDWSWHRWQGYGYGNYSGRYQSNAQSDQTALPVSGALLGEAAFSRGSQASSSERGTDWSSSTSGRWWETPQGSFWGTTLDDAIQIGLSRGWIHLDKAFCAWWMGRDVPEGAASQTSAAVQSNSQGEGMVTGQGEDDDASFQKKERTGKDSLPEYDGSTPIREYRRRVALFESVTSISPQFRGGRLLERLSGLAWKACETLSITDLKCENGVSVLLNHLQTELEPLEYMRTFQVLSHFFNHFKRQRGEQMTSFDTSFRIQCEKMREVGSPLEGTAKAWWFLQKAAISDEVRQKVVSAANGQYEYTKLRQALVAIIPDVNRHAAEQAGGGTAGDGSHRRQWQNGKKQYRVHAVENDEEGEIDDEDASDMEREAEVLITEAAKKRAAIEKARGFSQTSKPQSRETPEERAKRIENLKKKLPCNACKAVGVLAYGHWHSDDICLQKKKVSDAFVVENTGGEGDSEDEEMEQAFQVQVTGCLDDSSVLFAASKQKKEVDGLALSDTCCARSVAGKAWMRRHLATLIQNKQPFCCMREREPFRFGAGPRVFSTWAVLFPLCVKGSSNQAWIRCSIVDEEVPFLLSRPALKALGAIMDLDTSMITLSKLNTSVELRTTKMGLVGFAITVGLDPLRQDMDVPEHFDDVASINEVDLSEVGSHFLEVEIFEPVGMDLQSVDQGPSANYMAACGAVEGILSCESHSEFGSQKDAGQEPQEDMVLLASKGCNVPEPFICQDSGGSKDSWPSSACASNGIDDGAQKEGRVRGSLASVDPVDPRRVERHDHREASGGVGSSAPLQEGASATARMEKDGQARPLGLLPRLFGGFLQHGAGRALASVLPRSFDGGADQLRGGGQGGDGRSRGDRSIGASMPRLRPGNVGTHQQVGWQSVLGLCEVPNVQSNFALHGEPATNRSGPESNQSKGAPAVPRVESKEGQRSDSRQRAGSASPQGTYSRRRLDDERRAPQACDPSEEACGNSKQGIGLMGGGVLWFGGSRGGEPGRDEDVGEDAREQGKGQDREVIREPAVIRKTIAERQQKARHVKKGLCKRFLGNCRQAAMAAMMLTASLIGHAGETVFNSVHTWQNDRPDLLEVVFGGRAEVSCSFSKWGWWSLEPVDICCDLDVPKSQIRDELLERIDQLKPRLVVVSCPCTFYSPMTHLSSRSNQAKQQLRRLRQRERPFLNLTEDIFLRQIDRGDDALGANQHLSAYYAQSPIKRLLDREDVFVGIGRGCRFGARNIATGGHLNKLTLWFSSSPEICHELSLTCDYKHIHRPCLGEKGINETAGKYTPQITRAIMKGFVRTTKRKEPQRLTSLLRGVQEKLAQGSKDLKWKPQKVGELMAQRVFVVDADTGSGRSQDRLGITFEVPKGRWLPPVVKSSLKKLHSNLGHPSKADMQRFLRAGGVDQEMIDAVDWLRCSSCAQSARPRSHRTCRIPPCDIQFNDQVLLDCCQIKDVHGKGFWFLCMLDRATMYHTIDLMDNHTPESLLRAFRSSWKNAFGPPKEITIDQERGFIGPEFSEPLHDECTVVTSIGGQAHWQHGKIERHIGILKEMVVRVVKANQVAGPEKLQLACRECTRAKNSLIREHGFSPEQLVFGQEVRREGELWANGEPVAYHPGVGDRGHHLALVMRTRLAARKAFVEAQAQDMLHRTVRNRTRAWKEPKIGDLCFFYRENRKTKDKGVVSGWVGPAQVVGLQGNGNIWVTMGGRCYLVAQEMCREAVGEEELFGRPAIQQSISLFKAHRKGVTYSDLRDQQTPNESSLDNPPMEIDLEGDEFEGNPEDVPMFEGVGEMNQTAKDLSEWAQRQGWHFDKDGNPLKVTYNAWGYQTPNQMLPGDQYPVRSTWAWMDHEWVTLEDRVNWRNLLQPHELFSGGKVSVLITMFFKRVRNRQQLMCEDSVPICLKKPRTDRDHSVLKVVNEQERKQKSKKALKALDKEIPWKDIPPEQKDLFVEAKKKEWASWLKYDSVEILGKDESQKVWNEQRSRVLGSRFVYRNKHAGMTQNGLPLPVKAKARLCVAGQHSPDVINGLVQVDAPTIQRTSFFLVLHCIISWGWTPHWRIGDISNAFLQGVEYTGPPLYMKVPREGIEGVDGNCLMRLKKPVYGLPDAPRAWYENLKNVLVNELSFEVSVIDPALFIHRDPQGKPDCLVTTHVDDLMIASSGEGHVEKMVDSLQNRFPFGEWECVEQKQQISYCGREISVEHEGDEKVIKVRQHNFVEGRLSEIEINAERKKQMDDLVTEREKSDFRSTLGCLQWLATQTRADLSFSTNQLQKRIGDLRVSDLLHANRLVKEAKKEMVEITLRNLGVDTALVVYHDAGLYSSVGVEV